MKFPEQIRSSLMLARFSPYSCPDESGRAALGFKFAHVPSQEVMEGQKLDPSLRHSSGKGRPMKVSSRNC